MRDDHGRQKGLRHNGCCFDIVSFVALTFGHVARLRPALAEKCRLNAPSSGGRNKVNNRVKRKAL
jgi:hypothetical protein